MFTQRKIHHVLKNNGGEGSEFRYLPETDMPLNDLLLTDKVDGSTVQFTNGKFFKRMDNFQTGDPRKFTATEEERYRLEPLDDRPAFKHYLTSAMTQEEGFMRFAEMFKDTTVYFEALGSKIGARYKTLLPTIRCFDVSNSNGFLPFQEAVEMLKCAGLPIVEYTPASFENIDELIEYVAGYSAVDKGLGDHEAEGLVIRSNFIGDDNRQEVVRKIRKNDLKRILRLSL